MAISVDLSALWLASGLVVIWIYGWIKGRFRGSLIAVPVISCLFACMRLWDLLERCALTLGALIVASIDSILINRSVPLTKRARGRETCL